MDFPLYRCIKKGRNPLVELRAESAVVDDQYFSALNEHKWFLNKKGYVRRKVNDNGLTVNFAMHSEIMLLAGINRPSVDHTVDHISGSKLDNRLCNLRWATRAQQGVNFSKKNGLPVGVFKRGRKYVAQITSRSSGIHLHLGTFETANLAGEVFARKWAMLFPQLVEYRRA